MSKTKEWSGRALCAAKIHRIRYHTCKEWNYGACTYVPDDYWACQRCGYERLPYFADLRWELKARLSVAWNRVAREWRTRAGEFLCGRGLHRIRLHRYGGVYPTTLDPEPPEPDWCCERCLYKRLPYLAEFRWRMEGRFWTLRNRLNRRAAVAGRATTWLESLYPGESEQ